MTAGPTLLSWRAPRLKTKVPAAALTKRQADVLTGLCYGLTNTQICARLGLSEDTVKCHVKAVYRALGATSRAHAVSLATSGAVAIHVKIYAKKDTQ